MNKEILLFGDIGIDKRKFCYHKNPLLIDDVDLDKVLRSDKVYFGKKSFQYFIGFKDEEFKIIP